ncbi:N-acetylglucosamine-6-phosphate deacetylase [Alkalimonas sp. NCh-2]|uniref:N-acetylglucosamine-6-phosphate deacetylase n=1 Tax=Alkalimonas sp. NCh-2 TaxID=3144846 RepID=UPI0031F5FB88
MNSFELNVARLFDGEHWHSNSTVSIEQGRISAIAPCDASAVTDGILVPGFIDIQVNGGGGVLLNTAPTKETLACMMQAHARFGTSAMLPTVITDSLVTMQQAADAVAEAIAAGEPGILGIHFEGPHLSVPKKGVHPASQIRPLSAEELALYQRTDLGIRMVTVAPETIPPQQIRQLVAAGVIVFLGHSNADAATVQAALQAGATGFTHLYNAMSPLTSREPGMVGVALADPASWCGIILDGYHMDPIAAKVALAAKPPGKLLLVTDAMSPVGTSDTEFAFFDGKVTRQGNKLTNEAGSLAGSVLDMAAAVQYAVQVLGLELAEALRMAALYPAEAIGCADVRGKLQPGYLADMVLLTDDLQCQRSWWQGQPLWLGN